MSHNMSTIRCINCELRLTRTRIRLSQANEGIVNVIRQWTYPRELTDNDYICLACRDLASNASGHIVVPQRQVGHQNVCVGCGRSILRTSSRLILRQDDMDGNRALASIFSQWIQHRELTSTDQACIPCWLRAQRMLRRSPISDSNHQSGASNVSSPSNTPVYTGSDQTCVNCESLLQNADRHSLSSENESLVRVIKMWTYLRIILDSDFICHACCKLANFEVVSEQADTRAPVGERPQQQYISLPNIRRAPETRRHCLFPNCRNPERIHVPDVVRRRVLSQYNFFIPRDARICQYHIGRNMYYDLYMSENSMSVYNSTHIEDMIFILAEPSTTFNFEDIQSVPQEVVYYFLGITVEQHEQILNETQGLREMHRGGFALSILLCKLRTGDSGDRLSCLFKTPRRTLETLIGKARNILVDEYVPQHLGLRHITRVDVVVKNSRIANGIFGSPELPYEEQNAIVICDGTYVYTQKSTNYLFQKETYSLHKFRNLVKPFMVVCCNGYILDVAGPYPATTNDASIMVDLLSKQSFVEFFREDDVFILDRGFRDSVEAIHDHGFQAHLPETISAGESQLTTLQGNRSRCVTINRWVVEAVNGRLKRDYKIFRQEYFNRACPHMMKDFRIAAAFHNAFATMFTDPTNAETILNIVYERLYMDNILSEIVQELNLNRRNSFFHDITVSNITFPTLSMEELVLFACGTYQIRQARSYIGELFRFHGLYSIQLCREFHIDLSRLGGISPILIRVKVKSRHVSRKTYFVFIAVDRENTGRNSILGYCCNCIVGLRTVGCCSHVMSIVWYLGYARHQDVLTPPAQFLDEVLARIDLS